MKLINNSIYEIDNLEQLAEISEILYADAEFIEQNESGKRIYSTGLNNYYRFASGEEFQNLKDKTLVLDIPVAPKDVMAVGIRYKHVLQLYESKPWNLLVMLVKSITIIKALWQRKLISHIWKVTIPYHCGCSLVLITVWMYMLILLAYVLYATE